MYVVRFIRIIFFRLEIIQLLAGVILSHILTKSTVFSCSFNHLLIGQRPTTAWMDWEFQILDMRFQIVPPNQS